MLKRTKNHLYRNRHGISVFMMLNLACAICIALVAARVVYSENYRHVSLIWNLFLAWIPFILASIAHAISWTRIWSYIVIPVISIPWLFFFPNAPYMLTDLQDLVRSGGVGAPLWYDVLIVVWCSWTGMLLGIISLYHMQDIVLRAFGRFTGWVFVFVMSALSSFGMYIGRFVRLNSWDILQNPGETTITILGLVIDPSMRLAAFTLLYAVFFLFIYLLLYSFSHMLGEQMIRAKESPEALASTQPMNASQSGRQ
jgi:uncharacterized membrane protein